MFGFVQWDSPLALLIEVALSIVVLAALMLVARRVNATFMPPRNPTSNAKGQLQDGDTGTSAAPKGTQESQELERQSQHECSND